MKKFFAVLMCLIMVVVFMPTMAWAEGESGALRVFKGIDESGTPCYGDTIAITSETECHVAIHLGTAAGTGVFSPLTDPSIGNPEVTAALKKGDEDFNAEGSDAFLLTDAAWAEWSDRKENLYSFYEIGFYIDTAAEGYNEENLPDSMEASWTVEGVLYSASIAITYGDEEGGGAEDNPVPPEICMFAASDVTSADENNVLQLKADAQPKEYVIINLDGVTTEKEYYFAEKMETEEGAVYYTAVEISDYEGDEENPVPFTVKKKAESSLIYSVQLKETEETPFGNYYFPVRIGESTLGGKDVIIGNDSWLGIDFYGIPDEYGYFPLNLSKNPDENYFYISYPGIEDAVPDFTVTANPNGEGFDGDVDPEAEKYIQISEAEDSEVYGHVRKVYFEPYGDQQYYGNENLRIDFTVGEMKGSVEINPVVEVVYDSNAVDQVISTYENADYALGNADNAKALEVDEPDSNHMTAARFTELGTITADGNPYRGGMMPIDITLKPGYVIEKITSDAEGNNIIPYTIEANSYYAIYDIENQNARVNLTEHEKLFGGYLSSGDENGVSAEQTAAVIGAVIGGYAQTENGLMKIEVSADDPMQFLKEACGERYTAGLLKDVLTYSITFPDRCAVNRIYIHTQKIDTPDTPTVSGGILTSGKTIEAGAVEVENLKKLYSETAAVSRMYELEAEITSDDGTADVMIPVENASDYQVVWFTDDGNPVPVRTQYTEDNGAVIYTTGHFSKYALVKEDSGKPDDPNPPVNPGVPSTPSGGAGENTPAGTENGDPADQTLEAQKEAIRNVNITLQSKQVIMKSGKKAVKLTWTADRDIDFDGIEVYRSVKRYSGYGKKPIFITSKETYYNTSVKTGIRYYYKVRGFAEVEGEKIYTDWSAKAWRKVQ